jgi:hypothetical protein
VSGVISVWYQWIETYGTYGLTFTAIDLEQGTFTKFKLSDYSAGRLDIGDFTARGLVVLSRWCRDNRIIYNLRTLQLSRTPCQDTSNRQIQP